MLVKRIWRDCLACVTEASANMYSHHMDKQYTTTIVHTNYSYFYMRVLCVYGTIKFKSSLIEGCTERSRTRESLSCFNENLYHTVAAIFQAGRDPMY